MAWKSHVVSSHCIAKLSEPSPEKVPADKKEENDETMALDKSGGPNED